MEDEDTELNVDSFVDVVANVVGILIILTLLPIILSHLKSMELDTDKAELYRMGDENRGLEQQLVDLTQQISVAKAEVSTAEIQSGSLLANMQKAESILAKRLGEMQVIRKKEAALSSGLGKILSDETAALSELKAAEQGIARSAKQLSSSDIEQMKTISLAEMRAGLENLRTETAGFLDNIADGTLKREKLSQQLRDMKARKRGVETKLTDLSGLSEVTVRIRDPFTQTSNTRKLIWVECYVPEETPGGIEPSRPSGAKPVPHIRLVNPTNYTKKDNTLLPQKDGESMHYVPEEHSEYRTYLADQDASFKEQHYLFFLVRPDAYAAFRVAKELAEKVGWQVEWEPIEQGKVIAFSYTAG